MRNYNSKCHPKPLTQNSFKKSDRVYPQSEKLIPKNTQQGKKNIVTQIPFSSTPSVLPTGRYKQTYHLMLQNPFTITDRNSQAPTIDPTCLWFKNLQKSPKKGERKIKIKSTQYIIGNWTGDLYPHIIFVTIDGIWGYMDEVGKATNRVMALKLRQINPAMSNQSLMTYELRYSSTDDTCWEVPSDLTHIKMGLKIDDSTDQLELPLPNPLIIQFEIKDNE